MVATASSLTKRKFSHVRLIILLTTVLNTLDIKTNGDKSYNNLQQDLKYCRNCFETQLRECQSFLQQIEDDNEISIWQHLYKILPQRNCKRDNEYKVLPKTKDKVVAKYVAKAKDHLKWTLKRKELKQRFLQQERLDGMQFNPLHEIEDFITTLQRYHRKLPEVTLWLYLLIDIQPLLMPILYDLEFAVPKTFNVCGLTMYQQYAGKDLYHFFKEDFLTKLQIAKLLLEAVLKFSYGFGNYRLYITDLTADNLAYDVHKNKLYFIDLNSVFVLDFRAAKYKTSIHKHEHIECLGCFAYSPDDISAYQISDLNLYSACQLLREDLYQDQTKGFLYPVAENVANNYPQLMEYLNRCVDCPPPSCLERFSVAGEIIKIMEKILVDLNKS